MGDPVTVDHAFDSTWSGRYPIKDGRLAPTVKVGTTIDTAAPPAISGSMGVRRLTPRECERLQGFPDDWTRWDADGNALPDSARYRMMGNAVAVPVAEWVARRIMEAHR